MKKKLVVLSGAGISAESGISTFRDNGGLWDTYDVNDVASIDGWLRDPELVLNFYNARRKELGNTQPNDAHKIIANLEKEYDVTVITQNVDNLHERAGSANVIHLHGELTKVRPENCYNDNDGFSEKYIKDIGYNEANIGDKGENGAQLRPHIVFFGEAVPKLEEAIKYVSKADIMLIIGTSMKVYPAASLYRYAPYATPIYLIDPKPAAVSDNRIIHIADVATKGMKKFTKILKSN